MKTQGVSQRPQQPPQVATVRPVLPDERIFSQGKTVEDMDLIALAHMSFEEAAAQLFSQPSVSAEEFRAVYEKLHSKNEGEEKEAARLIEEQAHSWDAVDLAEEAQKEAELALADEKKKTAALETDVADLEIELANVKAVLRNQ